MFDNILIKTPEQIEGIRAACRDAALVLDYIEPFVKAGVTTEYLDDLMLRYTEDVLKDKSACLNYDPDGTNPYPKATCISVNHQICHGIPNEKLVRLLRAEHGTPLERVVQHHHWNGKDCPHTIRHTPGGWEEFLGLCEGAPAADLAADVEALAGVGIVNSPDYWKTGGGYADANVVCLLHAMAEHIRKGKD